MREYGLTYSKSCCTSDVNSILFINAEKLWKPRPDSSISRKRVRNLGIPIEHPDAKRHSSIVNVKRFIKMSKRRPRRSGASGPPKIWSHLRLVTPNLTLRVSGAPRALIQFCHSHSKVGWSRAASRSTGNSVDQHAVFHWYGLASDRVLCGSAGVGWEPPRARGVPQEEQGKMVHVQKSREIHPRSPRREAYGGVGSEGQLTSLISSIPVICDSVIYFSQ